jgi:hypothetical protein
MGHAIVVLARQRALREAKRQLHAQGFKPMYMPLPQIAAAADDYLAEHRAELIAEAKVIVDRWYAEGSSVVQNLEVLHKTRRLDLQGLSLCRNRERNGERK